MATAPTQTARQLQLNKSPLGPDDLILTGFTGHEGLSELFRFDLTFISVNDAIPAQPLLGQEVAFSVVDDARSPRRFFHGIVKSFRGGSVESGFREYHAEVVPWLWLLTRRKDCRVFQNKDAKRILSEVFTGLGFTDFDDGQIRGSLPKREYCVQYNETDFEFVSRIMEEEGIFYFFQHESFAHTMILADNAAVHQNCPDDQLEFEYTFTSRQRVARLLSWNHAFEFRSGKWAQTDYNFENPARSNATPAKILLTTEISAALSHELPAANKWEQFEYPGGYSETSDGRRLTTGRMNEEEHRFDVVTATSLVSSLFCGGKFTVKRHPIEAEVGKQWVISKIDHSATEPSSIGGVSFGGGGPTYRNGLEVIPVDVKFRPPRVTPKPRIFGVQTAVVTGPAGEEIYTDKYGRVKVQFFWDRYGKRDDTTSCFVRVAQGSAGKGWGSLFLPRIGQEVVVAFIEGDPDRPLISGVVYNAEQMPAYELPKEKNKSYVKTNSTLGGDGFNELRFDDTKDKEQVFLHAERNLDLRVKANNMNTIGGNRFTTIGYEKDGESHGNDELLVYGAKLDHLKGGYSLTTEGDMRLYVGIGEEAKDLATWVSGDYGLNVDGATHVYHTGTRQTKLEQNDLIQVFGDVHQSFLMNWTQRTEGATSIYGGVEIVLESPGRISFKVGPNFISLTPSGIFIQGTMVYINTGGAAGTATTPEFADPAMPEPAEIKAPTVADNSKTGAKSAPDSLE